MNPAQSDDSYHEQRRFDFIRSIMEAVLSML